jgi:hypothetical protein
MQEVRAEQGTERERRALRWIEALTGFPERFAGTASERAAAARVAEWMRELGLREVSLEPVESRPRAGLVLGLHAAAVLLGLLWGGFGGAALALLGALSFRLEMRERRRILSRWLASPPSVNAVGRAGHERARRRVVLSAHVDAAQAGFVFTPALADFFARRAQGDRPRRAPPPGPNALPEALMAAGALLAVAGAMGAQGFWFSLLCVGVGLGLLVSVLAGFQWAGSRGTPGANDNASAVAAMLTCAEQLLARLPGDAELWVVGTGAEEVGCCGMHALLAAHPEWRPEETHFVNFECVGGGALHWVRTEGTLAKSGYPPRLLELARRVAEGGGFGEVTPTDLMAGTDGHVPAQQGFPALSLISLEANGVPRNYHRPEDTAEDIDLALVVRAADFGAAVARAALRGEAGPLAVL